MRAADIFGQLLNVESKLDWIYVVQWVHDEGYILCVVLLPNSLSIHESLQNIISPVMAAVVLLHTINVTKE